jgi:hypothetical protein
VHSGIESRGEAAAALEARNGVRSVDKVMASHGSEHVLRYTLYSILILLG